MADLAGKCLGGRWLSEDTLTEKQPCPVCGLVLETYLVRPYGRWFRRRWIEHSAAGPLGDVSFPAA